MQTYVRRWKARENGDDGNALALKQYMANWLCQHDRLPSGEHTITVRGKDRSRFKVDFDTLAEPVPTDPVQLREMCRCCGRAIPRRLERHFFPVAPGEKPITRKEAESRLGKEVVYVSGYYGQSKVCVSAWDGESYSDRYFCGRPCATHFGYIQAGLGHTTINYESAKLRRLAKMGIVVR